MRAGQYVIQALETDHFRLDGGAMFGSVPRTLWASHFEPDEENRIPLVTRILYAEGGDRRIVVDTGVGHLWSEREQAMYGLPAPDVPGVVAALARVGVEPEDITDVILTHLHFDHAGGVTKRGADGSPVPTFPNATCYLQASNWENACNPNERERRSYLARHREPLQGPRLNLLDGEGEILPDVHVTLSHGHTEGLQIVRFGDGAGSVVFPSDMIPLATHVAVPWTMGYDLCPRHLMEEKRQLLRRAAEEDWIITLEHDAHTEGVRVSEHKGRFRVAERVSFGSRPEP